MSRFPPIGNKSYLIYRFSFAKKSHTPSQGIVKLGALQGILHSRSKLFESENAAKMRYRVVFSLIMFSDWEPQALYSADVLERRIGKSLGFSYTVTLLSRTHKSDRVNNQIFWQARHFEPTNLRRYVENG